MAAPASLFWSSDKPEGWAQLGSVICIEEWRLVDSYVSIVDLEADFDSFSCCMCSSNDKKNPDQVL